MATLPGACQPAELDSASEATHLASLASTGSEQLSSRRESTLSICPHASPAAVPLQCMHVNVRASGAKELRTRDEEAASSLPGSALPPRPKRISACYGIIAGAVPSPSSELSVPGLGRSVAPPEPAPEPEPGKPPAPDPAPDPAPAPRLRPSLVRACAQVTIVAGSQHTTI